MSVAVAILMKDPAQAKTRLADALGCDAREKLALTLFENTLGFFREGNQAQAVGVVTPSGRIAQIAHDRGAEVIPEDAGGDINTAAGLAIDWAISAGASSLLIIHSDVPTLLNAEMEALLEAGKTNSVVIAESIDGGTNALLLSPPDAIACRFGKKSAAAHEMAAAQAGIGSIRLTLPFLSRDLDTPDDLHALGRPATPDAASFDAFAVAGMGEVRPGDDLALLIGEALSSAGKGLVRGDIVVVAQKIVSKAEGRLRRLEDYKPSPKALEIAGKIGKDARKVEAILSESTDILRAEPMGADGLVITRHRNGWICANAGIDESNLGEGEDGMLLLLPEDADRSAATIRAGLEERFGCTVGVVVTDTFGRPWRNGLVNIAIGVSGVPAIVDWAGKTDAYGRRLKATMPAFADEISAAAGLLMQKDARTPVVVMRGLQWNAASGASAQDVLRPIAQELFL